MVADLLLIIIKVKRKNKYLQWNNKVNVDIEIASYSYFIVFTLVINGNFQALLFFKKYLQLFAKLRLYTEYKSKGSIDKFTDLFHE